MGHNYVIVVLPETIIQILLIVLVITGISLSIWQWNNERRRKKAIEGLETVVTKYEQAYDRMFNEEE
ncbi:hypothetical protein MMB75_25470 [Paenibacillus sp. P2(2022)]|uniref:hypothetical protein n=1 Tax=Paenibacillus TaxID=44249 RepID=UPI00240669D7|nr:MULTISPECIES: hypothetical protein [Paenibacillus]MDG0056979.1 hypothetical protein [Paenibacillus sp. P2(2022)]WHX37397.1 hypothetical protein QNH38_08120 [Paenibacillus polymyxa]